MKISIITPTFNSQKTIEENINSILSQSYENWEQIIIDNQSKDNTLPLIKKFNNNKIKIFSQKDNGIFDAVNKGIENSSGEIISILHSDDFYFNNETLTEVIKNFINFNAKIIYGNILYVKKNNKKKILRYWKSNDFVRGNFYKGWSPPHPSFFIKKELHDKFGNYDIKLGNSSDFEFMFRLLEQNQIKSKYIDRILVIMRYGGKSNRNLSSILRQNIVILKILGIKKNYINILKFLIYKFIDRTKQFFIRPKK